MYDAFWKMGLNRRTFLAGAGSLGVLAGASSLLLPRRAYAQGTTTLEFWHIAQGDNYNKVLTQAIAEYQAAHPNVQINLTVQPQADMDTKLRSIYTSGGPGPDIVVCGGVYALSYANMPHGFVDITDRINAAGINDKVNPGAWVTMEQGGKKYGIPFTSFVFLLHYNKDLYAAAGIANPPETTDELLANAKKITDPDNDTWGYLAFTTYPAWLLEQLWYNEGVGYFEGSENFDAYDITKPITITRPEAVKSLEYVKMLAETAPGGIQGNIGVKSGDADAAFARGNLGHYFTHTIHTSQIEGYNPDFVHQKNWDVAVFPAGSKRRGAMFSNLVAGISQSAKDQDAAWDFLSFLSGQYEGKLASSNGTVPLRSDVTLDDNQPGSWIIPEAREYLKGEIFPQSFFPQQSAFANSLISNEEAFLLGKLDAATALQNVANDATRALKA